MFVGYAEEDSDFEGTPLPPIAVYGSSNLTQATLEAVPWDVWVSIGKAAWPDQEFRYLTLRLNKHFLTICDDKFFCEALVEPLDEEYAIVRKNKSVLRKFVRIFKKHIISKSNEHRTRIGPRGMHRYTRQFNKALRRFWMIKRKLKEIQEFECDLNMVRNYEGYLCVGGTPFYVCCETAIRNQDWASFKKLVCKFFNTLQYHRDCAHPYYRALNLEWAKNINEFTQESGQWWCER